MKWRQRTNVKLLPSLPSDLAQHTAETHDLLCSRRTTRLAQVTTPCEQSMWAVRKKITSSKRTSWCLCRAWEWERSFASLFISQRAVPRIACPIPHRLKRKIVLKFEDVKRWARGRMSWASRQRPIIALSLSVVDFRKRCCFAFSPSLATSPTPSGTFSPLPLISFFPARVQC